MCFQGFCFDERLIWKRRHGFTLFQVLAGGLDVSFMKHSDECHVTMKEISIFQKIAKCIFLSQTTSNPACSRKSSRAKNVSLLIEQDTADRLPDTI